MKFGCSSVSLFKMEFGHMFEIFSSICFFFYVSRAQFGANDQDDRSCNNAFSYLI